MTFTIHSDVVIVEFNIIDIIHYSSYERKTVFFPAVHESRYVDKLLIRNTSWCRNSKIDILSYELFDKLFDYVHFNVNRFLNFFLMSSCYLCNKMARRSLRGNHIYFNDKNSHMSLKISRKVLLWHLTLTIVLRIIELWYLALLRKLKVCGTDIKMSKKNQKVIHHLFHFLKKGNI